MDTEQILISGAAQQIVILDRGVSQLLVLPQDRIQVVSVAVQGPPGAGGQSNFVGPDAPVVEAGQRYSWWQTGLGADGSGVTLWIEDGQ